MPVPTADTKSEAPAHAFHSNVAIFDLDRTLIPGSSLMALARELTRRGLVPRTQLLRHAGRSVVFSRRGLGDAAVENVRSGALAALAGHAASELVPVARDVGRQVASNAYGGARRLLELHQLAGDFCVLLSASPQELVEAVAGALGVHRAVGTRVEVHAGRFTGRLDGAFCYGVGKLTRLHQELGEVDLGAAHAYSDSASDVPLLAACGRPAAVNPDRRLRATARANDWPVIELS
ncbi:MAG TPA: HAD family hydrolase [Acidimicrobiales bacterium]|jgi:HAD superfamily hydrolase (TIGR01490 family)|nr:HAD family hydrolase [Acidimicrobiales bacterium]